MQWYVNVMEEVLSEVLVDHVDHLKELQYDDDGAGLLLRV